MLKTNTCILVETVRKEVKMSMILSEQSIQKVLTDYFTKHKDDTYQSMSNKDIAWACEHFPLTTPGTIKEFDNIIASMIQKNIICEDNTRVKTIQNSVGYKTKYYKISNGESK